jgi:ribosomal protein L28
MAQIYTIVKKNSVAHKSALETNKIKNSEVLTAGSSHVLVPSRRSVNFGHTVSHAKNRKTTRRLDNLRALTVDIEGTKKSIRISNSDLRTFKKVTKPVVVAA